MWDLNLGVQACQKNFKLFRHRQSIHALQRYKCPFIENLTIHIGSQGFCGHMHSGVVLVSNFFLGLHVPYVKETPSFGFSGDGLLLSARQDRLIIG